MAQAAHAYTTSKFHNLSNEALADALGEADTWRSRRRGGTFTQNPEYEVRLHCVCLSRVKQSCANAIVIFPHQLPTATPLTGHSQSFGSCLIDRAERLQQIYCLRWIIKR